ncbi:MAG: hypothetical protein HQM16_02225 [Deltaproteobacteria bacterium]|nr:hypothetical protein [Deltaproteobacteria bacterium]
MNKKLIFFIFVVIIAILVVIAMWGGDNSERSGKTNTRSLGEGRQFDPRFANRGGNISLFKSQDGVWESDDCENIMTSIDVQGAKKNISISNCPGICEQDLLVATEFGRYTQGFTADEISTLKTMLEADLSDNGGNYFAICDQQRCDDRGIFKDLNQEDPLYHVDECGQMMANPDEVSASGTYAGEMRSCECEISGRIIHGQPCQQQGQKKMACLNGQVLYELVQQEKDSRPEVKTTADVLGSDDAVTDSKTDAGSDVNAKAVVKKEKAVKVPRKPKDDTEDPDALDDEEDGEDQPTRDHARDGEDGSPDGLEKDEKDADGDAGRTGRDEEETEE